MDILCQNASCHIVRVCHIKDKAQNCASHRAFLKGEEVKETLIAERYYTSKNGNKGKDFYVLSVTRSVKKNFGGLVPRGLGESREKLS